jgi:hypothetical protein
MDWTFKINSSFSQYISYYVLCLLNYENLKFPNWEEGIALMHGSCHYSCVCYHEQMGWFEVLFLNLRWKL